MGQIGETVRPGREPSPKFETNNREHPPTLPDRDADSDPPKHAEKGVFSADEPNSKNTSHQCQPSRSGPLYAKRGVPMTPPAMSS